MQTSLKDVQTDNDFERKLLAEAIPPNELAVRFEDIGALDKVKVSQSHTTFSRLSRVYRVRVCRACALA
jgi:hypothetical protein